MGNMIVVLSLGWCAPTCVGMSPVATSHHGCPCLTSLSAIAVPAEANRAIPPLHARHKKQQLCCFQRCLWGCTACTAMTQQQGWLNAALAFCWDGKGSRLGEYLAACLLLPWDIGNGLLFQSVELILFHMSICTALATESSGLLYIKRQKSQGHTHLSMVWYEFSQPFEPAEM